MSGTYCGMLRDTQTCGVGSEGGTLGGIYTEGIYPHVPSITEGGTNA
jgi:hypothetical protein